VLLKRFYQKAVTLAPLETTYIYLSERDQEGGSVPTSSFAGMQPKK